MVRIACLCIAVAITLLLREVRCDDDAAVLGLLPPPPPLPTLTNPDADIGMEADAARNDAFGASMLLLFQRSGCCGGETGDDDEAIAAAAAPADEVTFALRSGD